MQLLVDTVEQRLIASDRLGIARMAGHPGHHLAALVEELVGDVGVNQRGQGHVLRLDHVELATQREREVQPLVAVEDRQLLPGALIKGLGLRVDRGRRADSAVPEAAGRSDGLASGNLQRGLVALEHMIRGYRGPAGGIKIVLLLQHHRLVATTRRTKPVGLADGATTEVSARHHLDDGVCRQRQCDILEVERGVLVLLRRIKPERLFLGSTQIGTDTITRQLDLAVHHKGQELYLRAVVDAGFHGCAGINCHQVGSVD